VESKDTTSPSKKLRFSNLVRVTLVPTADEYRDAGLHSSLWISGEELAGYKSSAYVLIKEYMHRNSCEFKVALKAYWDDVAHPAEDREPSLNRPVSPLGA
jgi:hypothetical protein